MSRERRWPGQTFLHERQVSRGCRRVIVERRQHSVWPYTRVIGFAARLRGQVPARLGSQHRAAPRRSSLQTDLRRGARTKLHKVPPRAGQSDLLSAPARKSFTKLVKPAGQGRPRTLVPACHQQAKSHMKEARMCHGVPLGILGPSAKESWRLQCDVARKSRHLGSRRIPDKSVRAVAA